MQGVSFIKRNSRNKEPVQSKLIRQMSQKVLTHFLIKRNMTLKRINEMK